MEIINRRQRMASIARKVRRENKTVGFVPTMVVVSFALFRGLAPQMTRVWEPDRGILGNGPLRE